MTEFENESRAILAGAGDSRHIEELSRLAVTLGVEVAGEIEQNRRDGAGYLGRGKREELRALLGETNSSLVITDDELTASQARVLERATGAVVVDRTELIIRIFEVHASDAASRLEVELADLEYRLPRVKGRNEALSRLGGGGVTTRGPGEQQLEYDRRSIRERMDSIGRKLKDERSARAIRGDRLRKSGPPSVALIGYTNAGKTTILNAVCDAGRSTKDSLFETLETTTRLVEGVKGNPRDGEVYRPDFVITDTVGFIRKLPRQLVHSFESTLEAARDAEIRVLCADASSESLQSEIETVREILSSNLNNEEADESAITILCLNKIDLLSSEERVEIKELYPQAIFISSGESNVSPLLREIYRKISVSRERLEMRIPHSDYAEVSRLYGLAEIHSIENTSSGALVDATLPRYAVSRYYRYTV